MTFAAFLPAIINAAATVGSSYLASKGKGGGESKLQRTQRKLIDQLIASLGGQGQFADLFNPSEEAFQKSFVDPAKAMFKNQISPQIQQSFIASGQQRGTGLDDTLTRAGVDLDTLLNQQYYQFQQDALNRKQNTINSILGGGAGAPNQTSTGQDVMSGLGGYFGSEGFQGTLQDLFKAAPQKTNDTARKGFENDLVTV